MSVHPVSVLALNFSAIAAVVVKKGTNPRQILLVKRGKPPKLGHWSLPGGKLEFGETLAQGVKREVLEETSLDVTLGPVITAIDIISTNDNETFLPEKMSTIDIAFHYVIVEMLAFAEKDAIARPSDDAADLMWVTEDQLDSVQPLSMGPQLRSVVRQGLSLLEEGKVIP